MSTLVTESFVVQFADNLIHLAQQRGSRLRNLVKVENSVVGKRVSFDRLGATSASVRSGRHANTPQIDTPHSRRWANMVDYDWADLIDNLDRVKLLVQPDSDYALAGAMAMGRAIDDEIITAFRAAATSGEEAGSTVAFPPGQIAPTTVGGLTLAKLIEAKELLDAADVDPVIPRHIAVTARQLRDLLGDTTVTSSDYNTVKALVQGEIDTFMGFKFIHSERIEVTVGAPDVRHVIAWAQDGVGLGIGKEITTRIDERPDKNYATQVYATMSIGAVRIEEEKVVQIDCEEA